MCLEGHSRMHCPVGATSVEESFMAAGGNLVPQG